MKASILLVLLAITLLLACTYNTKYQYEIIYDKGVDTITAHNYTMSPPSYGGSFYVEFYNIDRYGNWQKQGSYTSSSAPKIKSISEAQDK